MKAFKSLPDRNRSFCKATKYHSTYFVLLLLVALQFFALPKNVVGSGSQLVGSALEAEMMVGSWFVPDEVDVATAGLTLAGKPLKQLYKVGKTLRATAEVAARINRVRDKLAAAVPAVRKKLGHGNFTIVMKRKKYRVSREGHLGPNGQRVEAPMGELKEEEDILCHIPGGACFVKGTLVATQNGLRAIETLQPKDLVWSRDESSGKTELKPIAQTFEKYSTTLALTFDNGETIETTSEHPFYVVGRGFVKAGELGIGSSIVTRAGPSVSLVAATAGKAQTVYNFEVADYHTYFVGSGEVWVHNTCAVFRKSPSGGYYELVHNSSNLIKATVHNGELTFEYMADGNVVENGTELFNSMMKRFQDEGVDISRMTGQWDRGGSYESNINIVNRLTQPGRVPSYTLEQAAEKTMTGRLARNHGFRVAHVQPVGSPGNYMQLDAFFVR